MINVSTLHFILYCENYKHDIMGNKLLSYFGANLQRSCEITMLPRNFFSSVKNAAPCERNFLAMLFKRQSNSVLAK